jgi:hypothetical protein
MEKCKIVSLGYVCSVHVIKRAFNKGDKCACVFDNMAIPMWAVHDLIKNDFDSLMLKENMEKTVLFDNTDEKTWVDKKYNTRFGFYKPGKHEKYADNLNERIEHFKAYFEAEKTVLFIRAEEVHSYEGRGNRIMSAEYDEKYAKTEKEYLQSLSAHLKETYPELKFKILHLNYTEDYEDAEHGILGLNTPVVDYRDRYVVKKMKATVNDHKEQIDNFLN